MEYWGKALKSSFWQYFIWILIRDLIKFEIEFIIIIIVLFLFFIGILGAP